MKFQCPYCRRLLGSEPRPTCPACGRTMLIFGPLLAPSQRRNLRARLLRQAQQSQASRPVLPRFNLGRQSIVMLVILMVLAGLAASFWGDARRGVIRPGRDPRFIADEEVHVLRIALERFLSDCGRYPTEQEGLKALVLNPGETNWAGPYVNLVKPDPWRQPYRYALLHGQPSVLSCGSDRTPGTADDIMPDPPSREEIAPW